VIQFVHLPRGFHQRGVGFGAFAQQHDPGDNVVVVDDLSIGQMARPRELAQPDLGALLHYADIANRRDVPFLVVSTVWRCRAHRRPGRLRAR
jgi:hypothetical protein